MQIFKGSIHNTSLSNQRVAEAYFISLFAFLAYLILFIYILLFSPTLSISYHSLLYYISFCGLFIEGLDSKKIIDIVSETCKPELSMQNRYNLDFDKRTYSEELDTKSFPLFALL